MDKYEFNIKVEQMKKQAKLGDYETAMKIADGIDWRRVQNVSLLSLVSEIYEKNQEFGEAKDILLIAFERAPIGKGLLYKLTKLALNENSVEEAEAYYREFYDLAPDDTRQYILRYMILKAKGAPLDQLIHALETYNHAELNEKWMYELAELYHEAGRSDDCVRMCDSIMLMFGLGKYVDKAIELKTEKEGRPLTEYQQSLIDNRDKYAEKLKKVEEEFGEADGPALDEVYEDGADDAGIDAAADDEERAIDAKTDEEIEAHIREIDEQARLAKEVKNIGTSGIEADSEAGHTKIFEKVVPGRKANQISIEEDREAAPEESPAEKDLPLNAEKENQAVQPAAATEEPAADEPKAEKETPAAERQSEPDSAPDSRTELHWIIEGRTPEEGFSYAVERIKEIHAATGAKNSAAKIKASKLNEKGVLASAAKIEGRDLIVEEAGDLDGRNIAELLKLLDRVGGGQSILLVDNPLQINKLTESYPELLKAFRVQKVPDTTDFEPVSTDDKTEKEPPVTTQAVRPAEKHAPAAEPAAAPVKKYVPVKQTEVHEEPVPEETGDESEDAAEELDIDQFANYACEYAKKIDCTITGKSMLALYERIEILEEDGVRLTRKNAETLIEEAADRAEKPPLIKRLGGLFSPKYDRDGLLILKEDDFIS